MTIDVIEKPAKVAINGVDVPTLMATLDAVDSQRELAKSTFRANGEWLNGTHSRTRINGFSGAGGEHQRDADFGNIASARQVKLESVETTVEGDADLPGIPGLDAGVRNGFNGIRATFKIKGDAPEETLRKIVEQSAARSAVYDVLTNGMPVAIGIETD